MGNENRFKQSMAALVAVYQNVLQPETIAIYWDALGRFNPDHLDKAVRAHIADTKEGKWFPKPANLISFIKQCEERDRQHQEIVKASHRIEKAPPTDEQRKMVRDMIKELKA